MQRLKLIPILLFINLLFAKGQTGTVFWYAAPDISYTHANDSRPIYLHITAVYNTHVKISRPAVSPLPLVEFDLNANNTNTVQLDALLNISEIEVYPRNILAANFLQDKGFLIEAAPGEITAYVELVGSDKVTLVPNNLNTDIVALKSTNGLGKDFWVSTQRKYKNHAYSDDYSGFVVVATKDNTVVTIYPNNNNLFQFGTTSIPIVSPPLKAGQTFAIRANLQSPADHIFGIRVTSNNDIAITIYDDSMEMTNGGGSWDTFADQLIPVGLIGKEYIVLKGNVQDLASTTVDGEAIFITPTVNGTDIYIDGVKQTAVPLNAGQYFQWNVPSLALSGTIAMHVRATQPVYVNHVTGYSATGTRELGGAVLPSVDNCTGSHSVTIKKTPASGFNFFINLMVRNDNNPASPNYNKAISHFTYSINGGTKQTIPASHFTYIMGGAFAVYDRTLAGGAAFYNTLPNNQTLTVENDIARFHLGVMQGSSSGGCKYGYFSDYAASSFSAGIGGYTMPPSEVYCDLSPIRLVANGAQTYKWTTPYDPALISKLDYDTVAAPYFFPDTTGIYYFDVEMTGECQATETQTLEVIVAQGTISNFGFSSDEGCSPFAPTLSNYSDTVIGVTQIWTIQTAATGSYQINQDTIPRTFALTMPENHSDTLQVHTVKLVVKGVSNSCPSTSYKDIKVKPQVDAGFSLSDTIGCHPLSIKTINSSTGNLDSTSFNWDFGDHTQSFEFEPIKTFDNYSLNDTTFTVQLLVESPFGCADSLRRNVVVHPRVSARLAADTSSMCTPLVVNIDPKNSFGADTLWWNIDYFYGDSTYKTTSLAPINIVHADTSLLAGPDTLWVQLVAGNRMGCYDTAGAKRLITYPEVIADFTISNDDVCDSVPILISNQSVGYKIFYEWDFGNNTFRQDTLIQNHIKRYYNRTDADTVFTITLNALSGYFCESSKDTTITVHPYISADFGLNYETNCSPAEAIIYNTSIRAHNNFWDLGSGSFLNNAPILNNTFINTSNSLDTTYFIKLVTTNNEGCSDTLIRSIYLYPQVVSNFGLVKNSNCPPLDVAFTNNSTGGNLTYTWEFGDNTSSANPSVNFTKQYNNDSPNDVVYPIKLTARNQVGCDSSWYDTITVFAHIDAAFSLDDYENCPPFTIQATEDCSQGTNIFNWSFGDGNISPLHNPSNTYYNNSFQNDTLTVRLVALGVNDPAHQLCADTVERNVIVYPKLVADFEFTGDSVGCQPLITGIQNNSNLLTGSEFRWFIDNEFYERAQTPATITLTNTQSSNITKTVYLYGKTANGCLDTTSHTLTAYSLVDAYFTVDRDTLCSGDSINIDRQNSQGGISNYRWSFEHEAPASNPSPVFYHSFENLFGGVPTDKYVRLVAENPELCRDTMIRRVTIAPQVYAGFDFDNNSVCYPHLTQINNTTQYANSYFWDFGDNINSTQINPEHQYNNFSKTDDKPFTVKLIAKSRYNCFDSINKPIIIKAKPVADFYFPIAAACPPFEVQMDNSSIGNQLSYDWNFANEGTSSFFEPSHTFSNETTQIDERIIRLIANSTVGCSDTIEKSISVYPNVHSNFIMSDNAGCSPLNIDFTGTQNATAVQLLWFIDGRAFSTIQNPNYRFVNELAQNEPHEILYVVRSLYECTDSMTKHITVYPTPIGEFIPSPLPADYDTTNDRTSITFDNETTHQSNWKYDWDYGNEDFNHESAAEFTYNYRSFYWGDKNNNYKISVKMIAYNKNNPECNDTVIHDVIIYPPLPQVNAGEDLKKCVPYEVDFEARRKYLDNADSDSLWWDFGDGTFSSEPNPMHNYPVAGVYTVKLTVKGDGGTNRDYKIISVDPKPEIDFSFNDSLVFVASQTKGNDVIYFYNHTKYASNYRWYFDSESNLGGSPDSEEKEPSWFYPEIGVYYVALIAESEYGCLDTLINETPIRVMGEDSIWFPTAFYVDPAIEEYDDDNSYPTNKYIFRPRNTGIERYKLEIYNRWGVLVFTSNDVNIGWNGFIKGVPAKQDVYVWRANGLFTTGQAFDEAGDVTLIYKENK
jgi:PKD repeat protein